MCNSDLVGAGITLIVGAIAYFIGGPLAASLALIVGVALVAVAHMRTVEEKLEPQISDAIRGAGAYVRTLPKEGETTVLALQNVQCRGKNEHGSEMERLRASAVSLIYRLSDGLRSFDATVAFWRNTPASSAGKMRMMQNAWTKVAGEYTQQYRQEVIEARKCLMGHIRQLPQQFSTRVHTDRLYELPPDSPIDIYEQLADLRRLLNEMETENDLSLSCGDVKLPQP
jgi:hypothetical protein